MARNWRWHICCDLAFLERCLFTFPRMRSRYGKPNCHRVRHCIYFCHGFLDGAHFPRRLAVQAYISQIPRVSFSAVSSASINEPDRKTLHSEYVWIAPISARQTNLSVGAIEVFRKAESRNCLVREDDRLSSVVSEVKQIAKTVVPTLKPRFFQNL
jgi:hypothetical protein